MSVILPQVTLQNSAGNLLDSVLRKGRICLPSFLHGKGEKNPYSTLKSLLPPLLIFFTGKVQFGFFHLKTNQESLAKNIKFSIGETLEGSVMAQVVGSCHHEGELDYLSREWEISLPPSLPLSSSQIGVKNCKCQHWRI